MFDVSNLTNRSSSLNYVPEPIDRWNGVVRPYSADQVESLRGSMPIRYTLAERGAMRLWDLLHSEDYVHALGALTGNQAVQQSTLR